MWRARIKSTYINICQMYIYRCTEFFEIARLNVEGAGEYVYIYIYNVCMYEMYVCI